MNDDKQFKQPEDLSSLIHLLGDVLGETIRSLEPVGVFETEERIRLASKARRRGDPAAEDTLASLVTSLPIGFARPVATAFALFFDLVNLAEENEGVSAMKREERDAYPNPVKGSIRDAVETIAARGVTREKMAAVLDELRVELVLTAHPTEAKRRTILSKLNRIAELLVRIRRKDSEPLAAEEGMAELRGLVASLWLTDRSRTYRPAVTDEVRTGLYFIDTVFWELLPRVCRILDSAIERHYPGLGNGRAWIGLASWIGGDRDGNPNVTVPVTAETLRLHRGLAVEKHRNTLRELARLLSLSSKRLSPDPRITEWIEQRRPFPAHASYIGERYANEPFRLALSLLTEELSLASGDDMRSRLLSGEPHGALTNAGEIEFLLGLVHESVPASLSGGMPLEALRQSRIFGLHSARLDIREDASRLVSTITELLAALGLELRFDELDEEEKGTLLSTLLDSPPDLPDRIEGLSPETEETLALFRLITSASSIYGDDLVGLFIVSMTHNASDVLAALLLSRWTGCGDCLSVAPLIETIEDLERASVILDTLFANETYMRHLERNSRRQTVMVGYSDSNKDGGYLSANWALYTGQEEIIRACASHGVTLTLFHGRGGTAARGGGPISRAILSQPAGSVRGRFRLTEQGEVISSRYSNPEIARRHVEEIVGAVLVSSFEETATRIPVPGRWRESMSLMSDAAIRKYRSLVFENPGFYDFWQAATPIDEIGKLRMGSRPLARGNDHNSIEKVRAIPWVFSWMQSRFNIPGWFGLGSALDTGVDFRVLREMYEGWPFFSTLVRNTEMSLLAADMEIARMYAGLVTDQGLRDRIFDVIRSEYDRTAAAVLQVTGGSSLLASDPATKRSIELRNPYADPLNLLQIEMLKRIRSLEDREGKEAEAIREVIVITISGIASGLRNTG